MDRSVGKSVSTDIFRHGIPTDQISVDTDMDTSTSDMDMDTSMGNMDMDMDMDYPCNSTMQ
jgi:hypothetical protein